MCLCIITTLFKCHLVGPVNAMDRVVNTGDCSLGQYRQTIGMFNSYKVKFGRPHKSISETLVEILSFIELTLTKCANCLPITVLHSTLKLFIICSLSPFIFYQ